MGLSEVKDCKMHGSVEHRYYGQNQHKRLRCTKCISEAVTKRRRRVKLDIVDHFGGKCIKCRIFKMHTSSRISSYRSFC